MESARKFTEFLSFLQDELALPKSAIAPAIRNRKQWDDALPMLLWQYGFVSLDQLTKIFDWLDKRSQTRATSWLVSGELHRFVQV
jgi:Protein of unknown function (DUF2949)